MICVLLVAGHDLSLDDEIKNESSRFEHLEGVPKALLPGVGGKKILDYWWQIIKNRQLFSQVSDEENAFRKLKSFSTQYVIIGK